MKNNVPFPNKIKLEEKLNKDNVMINVNNEFSLLKSNDPNKNMYSDGNLNQRRDLFNNLFDMENLEIPNPKNFYSKREENDNQTNIKVKSNSIKNLKSLFKPGRQNSNKSSKKMQIKNKLSNLLNEKNAINIKEHKCNLSKLNEN